MPIRAQTSPTPWPALFFALLGLVWCGYIAFPTASPPPCSTSGCALFRDSRLAGLSLWWVGGAFFFILSILCLRGKRELGRLLALLALLADAILLLIMFLTAPCFDCLVVAALTGLCYYCLRPTNGGWFMETAAPSLLLPIWFGLFLGNCVVTFNERAPAYTLGNTSSSEVRLYFSPSCPACREAIASLGDKALLYPVEEREGDFEAIIRFEALLQAGKSRPEALRLSLEQDGPLPELSLFRKSLLSLQLLRNKAAVLRQGFRVLPLVQINGMPGFKKPRLQPEEIPVPEQAPHSFQPNEPGALVPSDAPPSSSFTPHTDSSPAALPLPDTAPPHQQPSPAAPPASSPAQPGSFSGSQASPLQFPGTPHRQPGQTGSGALPGYSNDNPAQNSGAPPTGRGPSRQRAREQSQDNGGLSDFLHNPDALGQCGRNAQQPCD